MRLCRLLSLSSNQCVPITWFALWCICIFVSRRCCLSYLTPFTVNQFGTKACFSNSRLYGVPNLVMVKQKCIHDAISIVATKHV